MSKAFTKEEEPEDPLDDAEPATPKGVRNLITPEGMQRLQDELHQLTRIERPKVVETVSWAAANGDRSENGDYIYGKKRLREIDRRTRYLIKRMEIAEVVDPALQTNDERVFFGATVTYADMDDNERTVRIVGTDEARQDRGEVSWVSPIARALMRASLGDTVKMQTPGGVVEIEIVGISYGAP